MSRFAKKKIEEVNNIGGIGDSYSLGHTDDLSIHIALLRV